MLTFEEIRKEGNLLFEAVRGSHLFGLNTEDSDIDTFGVFIGPKEWFLGLGKDKQLFIKSDKCDDYWDELEKYFKELSESNPEALISLFIPDKFILNFNPILKPLWEIKDELITKRCMKSFASYAISQIKKAKGLKKASMINPEEVKVRKTPLDFCRVAIGIGTWTLNKWLNENKLKQEYCGVSRLPGTIESYALFYDWAADSNYKEKASKGNLNIIGYRGVLSTTDVNSSQIRLSSIPKEEKPLCYFQFNSNAYSKHCLDYKRYWDWVNNRNPNRYENNKDFGWDSKNMCHCVRILTMATEMAKGEGVKLDRTNIDKDFLLQIKNHEISYEELIKYTENLEKIMLEEFNKSKLPEEPNIEKLNKILIDIRQSFYKI